MNIFIIILLVFLGLILLLLIVALLIKNDYAVEREIIINKPKHVVFDYLKYLKNQDNFSKWATMDPNMKKTFTGTDANVGFISAWESNQKDVGKGEQEITAITEGERIDYELRFIKPFKSIADVFMTTEAITETDTKVIWGFESSMKYPMNLMLLYLKMEEFIGNDFSTGLTKLKEILEKNSEDRSQKTEVAQ